MAAEGQRVLYLRVDAELHQTISELADRTNRSVTFVATTLLREAIEEYRRPRGRRRPRPT